MIKIHGYMQPIERERERERESERGGGKWLLCCLDKQAKYSALAQ